MTVLTIIGHSLAGDDRAYILKRLDLLVDEAAAKISSRINVQGVLSQLEFLGNEGEMTDLDILDDHSLIDVFGGDGEILNSMVLFVMKSVVSTVGGQGLSEQITFLHKGGYTDLEVLEFCDIPCPFALISCAPESDLPHVYHCMARDKEDAQSQFERDCPNRHYRITA